MFSRTENTIEEIKVKSIESGSKTANKIEPSSVDLRAAQANRNITTKNGKNNKKISPMKMPNFGLIDCRSPNLLLFHQRSPCEKLLICFAPCCNQVCKKWCRRISCPLILFF